MARTSEELNKSDLEFLIERHLGTLTTLRGDGSPHVVAIAFTYDQESGLVTIIASDGTQKVVNAERGGRAVVCQVDGPRWLSLEGPVRVDRTRRAVTEAVRGFEKRYRPARENPQRVAISIRVDRILGGT